MLFLGFCAVTGVIIAAIVWLYLKMANVGITVIWDMVPKYLESRRVETKYYTLLMCLVGGLIVGIFHRFYGPYPESMVDSIKRVKNTGTYPYKKLPVTVTAAFLSLFFGGAVGPESGLVCLLLGMACWAMDHFGAGRQTMEAYLHNNPYSAKGFVFQQMLKGLLAAPSHDKGKIEWTRPEQISSGVVAGIAGLLTYEILNALLGRGLSVPHISESEMSGWDRASVIILVLVGIGAGYLFLIFRRLTADFFRKLRDKKLDILNAVLGGLILGSIGSFMPMTMFSGGNDIQAIQYEYLQYTPYLLILIGIVKLFLTNVCIESGWRGGHFFPVIFSGLSIGYGVSILLGTNQILGIVVVTAALLGTMLQQPIGALVLSVIFFPIQEIGWMIIASFVAGCIPVPQAIRMNPDNKGFIYNISHMNLQKRLPKK